MNLNKVLIIGRVTANPELRKTTGGASVTSFGLATNRVWTDQAGAKQDETEFHNIVAWGRTAEIASQYLTKGALAHVEGRLQTRTWQDKQGTSHKTTEIICERLQLGPKPQGQGGGFSGGAGRPDSFGAQKGKPSFGNNQPEEKPQVSPEEIPVINMDEEIKEDVPF